jgi:hypothetical protein
VNREILVATQVDPDHHSPRMKGAAAGGTGAPSRILILIVAELSA